RERQVLHPTRLAQSADIAPDVEDAVPIVRMRRVTGADTGGKEMHQHAPWPVELLQRLHEGSRSGARATDEDLVARANDGHCLFDRDLAVLPVGWRLDAHAASAGSPPDTRTPSPLGPATARRNGSCQEG